MSITATILKGAIQLNGNPIKIDVETTTSGKTLHYLLCEVTCTNGTVKNGPWLYKVKTDSGSAQFDLKALFNIDIDQSFNDANIFNEHALNTIDLSIKVGERYIENDAPITVWGETKTLKLLNGGLSKLEIGHLNSEDSTFYDTYILGKKFLTKLGPYWGQKVYVHDVTDIVKVWFCYDDTAVVTPYIGITYSDGTASDFFILPEFTPQGGILYEVNLHNMVDEYAQYQKPVESYRIHIGGDWFEVYISDCGAVQHNQFVFKNSLGCFEAIHCFGELVDNSETEGEAVIKPQSDTASIKEATKKMPLKSIARKYQVNSGNKTLGERRWLLDMLRSDEIYWRTNQLFTYDPGFKYIPINIIPGSYKIDDTSEQVQSVPFDFEIAHTDKYC